MTDKRKSQFKIVGLVMIITLSGKILGLFRDILVGQSFGTGMEGQAFLAASRIPRTFFDAIFASAISSSFIPVFNEYLERDGRDEAYRLSNSFMTIVGLFTALLSLAGIVFSRQAANFFVDGYSGQTLALCSELLKILFPTIFFTGIAYSMVGILQSQGRFNVTAALSTVSNGIIIIYFFTLNDRFGIYGLAIVYLVGWAFQMFMQMPSLRDLKYRYRPALRHDGLKKIFALMLPVMVSTWIQPINYTISTKLASRLFDGVGGSAFDYANSLYTIIAGVLVLSIVNVIFPDLSKFSIRNKMDEFSQSIKENTKTVLFLLVPMTVGVVILGEPIVRLLYQRGEFTDYSTEITSRALIFMSLGMAGYGVQTILSRAYYALKNGRVPLLSGIISIAVNILLSLLLIGKFDVAGLGIASSLSMIVAAAVMIVPMQKKTGNYIDKKMCTDFLKMALAAVIMGAAVLLCRNGLMSVISGGLAGRIAVVGLPALLGVVAYMAVAKLLRLEQADIFAGVIKKVIGRKGS